MGPLFMGTSLVRVRVRVWGSFFFSFFLFGLGPGRELGVGSCWGLFGVRVGPHIHMNPIGLGLGLLLGLTIISTPDFSADRDAQCDTF